MQTADIQSTTLDAFTFRRCRDTKKIDCECELSLYDEKNQKVATLKIPIKDVPQPHYQSACTIAMFLHQLCRVQLREIGAAIPFSPDTPWLK